MGKAVFASHKLCDIEYHPWEYRTLMDEDKESIKIGF